MSAKRLRVLFWHWGRRGGGPRYTYELVRALAKRGDLDVHLSLSRQSEIFEEFENLNLPSCHINTYNGRLSAAFGALRLPGVRRRLWRYVEDAGIDVVVGTMSHLWNVPMLAGRFSKVPYLMVVHDALPHPGDDLPLRHWLLKREIGFSHGVVALTEHVRRILCDEYAYPARRTWVIPLGAFSYGRPLSMPRASGPTRLLFFGRVLPYKGLDLLLEAYTVLRRERKDIELMISGPGDLSPYEGQLRCLEGVSIDNRWILEKEIGPIFRGADVSILPYREASQSGVIATAYAAGVPVVITPVGGLAEQVKHEQTGLVCASASPKGIADALRRMLDEPGLLARCAKGASQEAEVELAWPSIASHFSRAIEEVLLAGRHDRGAG